MILIGVDLVLPRFSGTVGWEDAGCFRLKELSVPKPYPAEFRRQAPALVASGRTVVDVAASYESLRCSGRCASHAQNLA